MPGVRRPQRGPFRRPRTLVKIQDLQPIVVESGGAGQGGQAVDAAGLLQFIAVATPGQGTQTVDAAALLQFIAAATSGQGSQTVDPQGLLQFIASTTSGQGGQTVDAAALLQFIGADTSGQGGETVDATALLAFIAAATDGQGSQSIDGAALEQFIASAASGQGAQTVDSTEAETFLGGAISGQGAQAVDALGDIELGIVGDIAIGQGAQSADGVGEIGNPAAAQSLDGGFVHRGAAVRIDRKRLRSPAIYGAAESGGHGGSLDAEGTHVPLLPVEGGATSAQPLAEVIAIGTVDNRRPRNSRKQRIAAALLLAA